MLLETAVRHTGHQPARFSFRGLHPMFLGGGMRLTGTAGAGSIDLGTATAEGYVGLQARMEWT